MTHHYAVFGATIESSVELPELRTVGVGKARWHYRTVERLAPMHDAVEVGSDHLYADVHARLYAHADGHRIVVDDTGSFELSHDRSWVTWEERAASWPEFVRAHLVGRVLATALYLDGLLPLHGSAVALRDGVVAFLAPKGHGKSTLALALVRAGARLVTDDTLPVELGTPPRAWPGVQSVRLRDDALAALGGGVATIETREGKRAARLDAADTLTAPATLRAIYLLDPGPVALERTPLAPTPAALALTGHVKIGRMLGAAAAGEMLARAARIAAEVPVQRLSVPRDLGQLPTIVETLLSWHGGPR